MTAGYGDWRRKVSEPPVLPQKQEQEAYQEPPVLPEKQKEEAYRQKSGAAKVFKPPPVLPQQSPLLL